jgi:copper transport protein
MKLRHVLALGAATVACLLLPATAGAHAYLLRTDPADGSRFDWPPHQIRLWFSEDVSAKLSHVKLTGARTGTVAGTVVTDDGTSLIVSLPKLARDTYSLYWLTVSADDLHITRGTVAFSLGTSAAPPPTTKERPGGSAAGTDTGEVALRWLDFGAIAGLIGALALLCICLPRAARRGATGLGSARRRLSSAAVAFGAAALATGVGLLLVQAVGVPSTPTASALDEILFRTGFGPYWIAREVLIAVLLVLAIVLGRRRPSAALIVGVALASCGLCVAVASNSHAAAIRGHLSPAIGVLAVHLLAAALWVGGLFALALVLIGRWRAANPGSARLLLRSFGGLAALSVAVIVITGLYSAGVAVASADGLILTFYGRALLLKTALFLVVGAIGLANSLLVRTDGHTGRWFGRTVRIEAGLMTGIILLAALLTASAPARGPRFLPTRTAGEAPAEVVKSIQAGDLLITLSVKPNQPGENFVRAGVFDTRRPPPARIRAVDLSVGRAGALSWRKATQVVEQYWQLTGNQLARSGRWSIGVRIHRAGMPDQVTAVPWVLPRLRPQVPVERTVVSRRPLAPVLSAVATIAALLLLAALLVLFLIRRVRPGALSKPLAAIALRRRITIERPTPAHEKPRLHRP